MKSVPTVVAAMAPRTTRRSDLHNTTRQLALGCAYFRSPQKIQGRQADAAVMPFRSILNDPYLAPFI